MRRIMILLLLAALLAGCGRREQERQAGTEMLPTAAIWQERSVFAMDTLMQIKVYGGTEHLLDKAQKQIFGLEESLSVTLADSEIAQLNRNGRRRLSGDPLQLLDAVSRYLGYPVSAESAVRKRLLRADLSEFR